MEGRDGQSRGPSTDHLSQVTGPPRESLPRTFLVAELVDDHGTRDGVKCQRVHVAIVEDVLAQARVIRAQHTLRGTRIDIALAVVAGMKQQRRAALDADIAQAQEQRAVRLAMAPDAKQFAA